MQINVLNDAFYIWFCVSRQYPEQKYKGLIGKFFTLCSERFLHPYLASSISKFFSLGIDLFTNNTNTKTNATTTNNNNDNTNTVRP